MMEVMIKPKPCCSSMSKALGDIVHYTTENGIYFSTDGDPEEFDYARLHYCPWCGEEIKYVGE
jgi:hypothetical protein